MPSAAQQRKIYATSDGLAQAQARLGGPAGSRHQRQTQLDDTQSSSFAPRVHLTKLERKEARAQTMLPRTSCPLTRAARRASSAW